MNKQMVIQLDKKQQTLFDKCVNLFGCIPPNYVITAVITDKVVSVKFSKETVKLMLQNAPHTRNKFHRMLCEQLSTGSGLARCNDQDKFDENRGLRLAKLRFVKYVANVTLGCYKQLHADMTKKFENMKNLITVSVDKMDIAINKYGV